MYHKPIEPIPTRFDGHYFRSRLEARWALFFKECGIAYDYEKQGYRLPNGKAYLPDFFLPKFNLWVEIKPNGQTREQEIEIINNLASFESGSENPIAVFFGLPSHTHCGALLLGEKITGIYWAHDDMDGGGVCPAIKCNPDETQGIDENLKTVGIMHLIGGGKRFTFPDWLVEEAALKASEARFE